MTEQPNMYEQAAAEVGQLTDERLSKVGLLAERQIMLEDRISGLELELAQAKEELLEVSGKLMPEALQECGLTEITMKDGTKISVVPFYSAKIPDERKDEAFAWLREHNHGALIKNELKVSLKKGEDERAEEVIRSLSNAGFQVSREESVHWQTLRAFVKEQVEGGVNLPMDVFGAYVGQQTKIKRKKQNG